MISYVAVQDALTALLVLLVISVVITLAWLSTNVREQPLVAFVVFHSSHNGEREQNQRADMSEGNTREQQEASAVRQTVEVDSNGGSEAKMKIKQTDSGGGGGVSDSTSDNSSSTVSVKKNTCGDADLVKVEEVNNSLEEVTKDTDNTVSQSTKSKESEDVASDSAQKPDDASTSNRPPKDTPDRDKEALPETELRKRRLQQFISMGDTTTTTHLERLSEQLMATLPSELSEQQQSSTEDSNKSSYKDGARVEEVCSSEGSTKDTLPASSADTPLKEEVPVVEEERPPGSIKIRLKFLDETQKYVFAQLTEQVGSFKRQHFSIEMDANRRIRLIFNGQLLSQDTSTLAQYGLFDNCVVHCHVSQPQHNTTSPQSREAAAQDEEDAYVSRLLAPLLYGVLAVMWYLRYEYGHLFNAMSTLILLFLTALLVVSTYLLYVTHHLPEASAAATASATTLPHPQAS